MDEYDRFMIRQRALRRARLPSGQARDLWGFEHWRDGPTQDHHPGRRKFSTEVTITVPAAMHTELTRRGEEEHPPLGPDPGNRLEREARLHFGWSDMHAALSDAHRWIGDAMFAGVIASHQDINAVHIPKGLLRWIARVANDLPLATRAVFDKDGE
jgi:hypothetical protein